MVFRYRVVTNATADGLAAALDAYAENDPSFRVYGFTFDDEADLYCALIREDDAV